MTRIFAFGLILASLAAVPALAQPSEPGMVTSGGQQASPTRPADPGGAMDSYSKAPTGSPTVAPGINPSISEMPRSNDQRLGDRPNAAGATDPQRMQR